MISYLKGEILNRGEGFIVLLCGNIGYEVYLPGNRALNCAIGQTMEIYTYLYKREDALQLYGFSDWQEREIFLLLINVSGIGPKAAMAIIGELTNEGLYQAIVGENIALLTKVPGIGKKTAQRLVLELKDKVEQKFAPSDANDELAQKDNLLSADDNTPLARRELYQALESLGYQQREIREIYPKIEPLFGVESEQNILKKALQLLMRN